MVAEIDRLRKENESLGGNSRCAPSASCPGSARMSPGARSSTAGSRAVCSIQSVKGVSLGEAWDVAGRPGSEAHDEIFYSEERGWYRETNRAGGLEGGMTNGEPLVVQAAIKPISTMTQPLRSVDTETKEPAQAMRERTDSTVVPAAAVVAEAMVALVLAAPTGRSSAATTSTTCSPRSRPTGSASDGGGTAAAGIVFIGFMAAGKSTAHAAAERARARGDRHDELIEAELGEPISGPSSARARPSSAPREAESSARCSSRPSGGAVALGGGATLESGSASARAPHGRLVRSTRRSPGGGPRAPTGRWPSTARTSPSASARAPRSTSRWPAVDPAGDRGAAERARRRSALAGPAGGTNDLGRRAPPLSGHRRRGGARTAGRWPLEARRRSAGADRGRAAATRDHRRLLRPRGHRGRSRARARRRSPRPSGSSAS